MATSAALAGACQVGCFASFDASGEITAEAKQQACAACRGNTHRMLIAYCTILEANPDAFDYMAEITIQ